MKIMTHIKNNLKSIFAAVAMVVQMASVAEDITWTAVTNQLNDIDPRLQLGVYIQNVTSNTISESVVGIVEEYVSPLIDTAIETSTNYTDYAVIKLAETNSVLSGGPYQHELPYLTNAIPYSVIIDAPQMESDKITDGTNTIDAAGNVWISESVSYWRNDYEWMGWFVKSVVVSPSGEEPLYTYRAIFTNESTEVVGVTYGSSEAPVEFDVRVEFDPETSEYIVHVTKETQNLTNYVGKLALTNDIPLVVSPSTNATAGAAADALATGTALYTGFTEWSCDEITNGYTFVKCEWIDKPEEDLFGWYATAERDIDHQVFGNIPLDGNVDSTILVSSDFAMTISRHLVTPTKTSQLQNNGTNGVPFITASELEKKRDVTDLSIRTVPTDSNGARFMVNGVLSKGYDGSMPVWSAPDGTSPYWNIFIDGNPPTYYIEVGTSLEHFTISESNGYAADVTVEGVDYHIVGISDNSIATTAQLPQNYDIVSNRAMSSIGTNVQGNVLGSFKKMYFSLYPEVSPKNIVLEAIDLDVFKIDCNDGIQQYLFGTTSSPNGVVRMSDLYGKQDALTLAQTNAINSGVTSDKVETWDGYASQISNKADMVSVTGVVDYAISEFGRTNLVYQITDGTNTINASGEVYKKIGIGDGWILVSGLDIGGNPVWRTEELGESVSGWYAYGLEFGFQLISTEYDAIEITGVVVFARYESDEPGPTIITTTNTWVRVNTAEKFLGKVAMTNDAVAVVAPSTNAISGTAADARDTGIAIYTGFTDWKFSDGSRHVVLGPDDSGVGWWYHYITEEGYHNTSSIFPTEVEALCATNLYFGNGLFATRHLVTPTRTSQLDNDSGFITSTDLPYRLVTPGEWEFSDGGSHTINGPNEDQDGWVYQDSVTGYYSQFFDTEANALAALSLTFTDGAFPVFTATRPSLPGHLLNRAVNRVIVSQTTELTIPESNVGRVRDFYVYMTVSGATQRVSFSPSVQYVSGRVNPDRTYSPATYFLHFMEITNGLFNVVDDLGTSGIVLGEKATGTIGIYSVTSGRGCLASGWYSQASGYFVEAKNSNEFSFGRYNNSHRNDGEFGTPSNTLWSVGCGIGSTTRMNAIETMQDGKTFVYGIGGYDGTNPTQSGVNDIASVVNRFPFTNSIASADALLVQPNTTTITSWDTNDDLEILIGGTTSYVPRECRLVVVATTSFNITLDTTKYYNVESPLSINRGTTNVFSFTEFMPDKFIVTKQTIGGSGN